jgi:hypothetical protein
MSWYFLGGKMHGERVCALFKASGLHDIQARALLGGMVITISGLLGGKNESNASLEKPKAVP